MAKVVERDVGNVVILEGDVFSCLGTIGFLLDLVDRIWFFYVSVSWITLGGGKTKDGGLLKTQYNYNKWDG